jgi:proteasome lid subunit RPN8/RPN11
MWGMALRLSREHHQQLLEWAKAAYPRECCGLILGRANTVQATILSRNVAADPEQRFEIDPQVLVSAHRQAREGGLPVLGYAHSHPNGAAQPSQDDADCANPDGAYWLIIAGGGITCWQASANGTLYGRFKPVQLEIVDKAEA